MIPPLPEDTLLLERYAAATLHPELQADCWNQLYRQLFKRLRLAAFYELRRKSDGRCSSLLGNDEDDLAHSTIMKLHFYLLDSESGAKRILAEREPANFLAAVVQKTLRSRTKDLVERKPATHEIPVHTQTPTSTTHLAYVNHASTEPRTETILIEEEQAQAFIRCKNKLPIRERTILDGRLQDRPWADLASTLAMSQDQARYCYELTVVRMKRCVTTNARELFPALIEERRDKV